MTGGLLAVGTDIGGTFTDMVVVDHGAVQVFKTPTTPQDRSLGVLDAFRLAAEAYGLSLEEFCGRVGYFAHGTTTATNALIERKGAPTALLTTKGVGDTLLIQRTMGSWTGLGAATGHFSLRRNPVPIVPKNCIVEIRERVDFSGEEVVGLDHQAVREAARRLRASGVRALAVSFLWSFVRPDHEQETAKIIREEWPEVFLSLSSDVAPIIGEYERTATTVINAYLGPVISHYVGLLETRLRRAGFTGDFAIMDSGGGVMRAAEAAGRAAAMLTSGPAGGVLASAALGRRLGYQNVIASDMGGTSFDVGLIVDGEPLVETAGEVGVYHLALPRIRVTSIGSGGGSIARVDEGGILVVGPESAGADPGPASYGKGGREPTVTDADVVLGIIDPAYFLGGRMQLRRDLAEETIRRVIAEPLGMTVAEAAAGIRSVVDNQMADLLRKATVEQGYDPRDFVLFAYGGAGPTHAHAYGSEAGIDTIVVPAVATAQSAYGAVSSDRFRAFQLTDTQRTPPQVGRASDHLDVARINGRFQELERRCVTAMEAHPQLSMNRILYFRFRRQTHELPISVPNGELRPEDVDRLAAEFHGRYERLYGKGTVLKDAGIEINTYRVEGRIPTVETASAPLPTIRPGADATALLGYRDVRFGTGQPLRTPVYRGEAMRPDSSLSGPAILEFAGTTVVVGPEQDARVDAHVNIIIRRKREA